MSGEDSWRAIPALPDAEFRISRLTCVKTWRDLISQCKMLPKILPSLYVSVKWRLCCELIPYVDTFLSETVSEC